MYKKIFSLLLTSALIFSGCASRPDTVDNTPNVTVSEEALPECSAEPESSANTESSESEPSSSSGSDPSEETPKIALSVGRDNLKNIDEITDEYVNELLGDKIESIQKLPTDDITWGPGLTSDEKRPIAPVDLQAKYGHYGAWFIAPDSNKIYLTFDEGYDGGQNEKILDVLKDKDVKAVFFVTIDFVKQRPDIISRIINEGHTLGNHTAKHIPFPTTDIVSATKDVMTLHNYVEENFGYTMTLCRPPAGSFSEQTLALLQALGYDSIFWSFAYRDWLVDDQPEAKTATETILGRSHPGAIYLLHSVSSTNASILGDVIDSLKAKDYELAPWDL